MRYRSVFIATFLVWLPVLGSATPYLASITPSEVPAGSGAFALTVLGSGFGADSVVTWNGSPLATYYVNSSSSLTASVPTSLLTSVGHFGVTVTSGGGTSNSLPVYVALPSVSETYPYLVNAGSAATGVDVQGADFASGAVGYWNSTALATRFLSPSDLNVTIPATLLTADGEFTITVVNPAVSHPRLVKGDSSSCDQ